MRLLRFGPTGAERPGMMDPAGAIRDLSGIVEDIDGAALSAGGLALLRSLDPLTLPRVNHPVRFAPCVGKVGKFICIGLNYRDHAAETGADLPSEPIVFMKATSAICGPNDPIIKPRGSTKLDWEVELAIVIGSPVSYADEAEAAQAIAGYCICNDLSERAFQLERGGQWPKGKSCDTFGPIGPWLVTADEIADVGALDMWLDVNGVRKQQGNTSDMIFKPAFLVSYLSRFMSLQPGDIISTGTPAGVALGRNPPAYLELGDRVELSIAGLGIQRQVVVPAD